MTVYKLDGDDPAEAWNALITAINDSAEDCSVEPLELLEDPAIWSQADVQEAIDKLLEMCPEEFNFSPVPTLWKQSTIDELVEALESIPDCCCEEEDRDIESVPALPGVDFDVIIDDLLTEPSTGFTLLRDANPSLDFQRMTFDWAGWIMQEWTPLTIQGIECPVEEGEAPIVIEKRSGGPGWVGRGFKRWEMRAKNTKVGDLLISSGTVTDGYIDIGEGNWRAAQTCDEPTPIGGTLQGEIDPDWRFPFIRITLEETLITVRDVNGDIIWDNTDGISANSPMNPSIPTSPFFIDFPFSPFPEETNVFLRLLCESE